MIYGAGEFSSDDSLCIREWTSLGDQGTRGPNLFNFWRLGSGDADGGLWLAVVRNKSLAKRPASSFCFKATVKRSVSVWFGSQYTSFGLFASGTLPISVKRAAI